MGYSIVYLNIHRAKQQYTKISGDEIISKASFIKIHDGTFWYNSPDESAFILADFKVTEDYYGNAENNSSITVPITLFINYETNGSDSATTKSGLLNSDEIEEFFSSYDSFLVYTSDYNSNLVWRSFDTGKTVEFENLTYYCILTYDHFISIKDGVVRSEDMCDFFKERNIVYMDTKMVYKFEENICGDKTEEKVVDYILKINNLKNK